MDPLLEMVLKEMKQDIRDVNEKVDKLLQFKFQIVGGSIVISIIITLIFQFANTFSK